MKDRSLFHLLMARLRQLTNGLAGDDLAFVEDLKQSLKVEYKDNWFSITWRWQEKEFNLNSAGDTFQFYVHGDISKQSPKQALRRKNWDEAEILLRRIAEISGGYLPQDRRPGSLSDLTFEDTKNTTKHARLIVPGALASLISFAETRLEIAIWTGITAVALCYLIELHRHILLKRPIHWLEPVVIALSVLVPSYFGVRPSSAALLAVALVLVARAEFLGPQATIIDWAAAGAMMGTIIFAMGWRGWVPVVILVTFVLFVYAVLPNRLQLPSVLVAAAAALCFAVIASVFPVDLFKEEPAPYLAMGFANWPIAFIFGTCFLVGWIFGQQFLIFPWLGYAIITIACVTAASADNATSSGTSFVAFAGYGICVTVRLLSAFTMAQRYARR